MAGNYTEITLKPEHALPIPPSGPMPKCNLCTYLVGPQNRDLDVRANLTGLDLGSRSRVLVQTRCHESLSEWTDQFSVHVVGMDPARGLVVVRIRRIDDGSHTMSGWGQELRLDVVTFG